MNEEKYEVIMSIVMLHSVPPPVSPILTTLKALVLNQFRTALRSVTRMYSAHSGIDSGIGRKRKLILIITLTLIHFGYASKRSSKV